MKNINLEKIYNKLKANPYTIKYNYHYFIYKVYNLDYNKTDKTLRFNYDIISLEHYFPSKYTTTPSIDDVLDNKLISIEYNMCKEGFVNLTNIVNNTYGRYYRFMDGISVLQAKSLDPNILNKLKNKINDTINDF